MSGRVKFEDMLASLRHSLEATPEHRTGSNVQYSIVDAGLGAFAVFCLQSPSFLAYQQQMRNQHGQDNAKNLFGMKNIRGEGQTRNLLDPVAPSYLREPFWDIYHLVQHSGYLETCRHVAGTVLMSFDGTRFFSSERIHCDQCTVYEYEHGTSYAHMVVGAVVSAPGQPHVFALEPEFITPQGDPTSRTVSNKPSSVGWHAIPIDLRTGR